MSSMIEQSALSAFYLFSTLDSGSLLFLSIYTLVTLSDLECDYLNARQCSSNLNKWVLPELIGSAALTLLLLITYHWWLLLFNAPMTIWLICQLTRVPKTQSGLYDPNELLGKQNIQRHTRRSLVKIAFYLIQFFLFLYSAILSLFARR